MTAGQPQPLQTYQELVNRLYQQSNYDFVGVAPKLPLVPTSPGGYLWRATKTNGSGELFCDAGLGLPASYYELAPPFGTTIF